MAALVLIAAVAANGTVGKDGALPWRLPEDLAHFRRQTQGAPVIMGRNTWESLPAKFRPLPGRHNIVVTRNTGWQADGASRAGSLDEAIALAGDAPRAYVIGGAALYAAALPQADELLLTEIERAFDGDVHFPAWDRADFAEASRERHYAPPPNGFDYSFVRYVRRSSNTSNPP